MTHDARWKATGSFLFAAAFIFISLLTTSCSQQQAQGGFKMPPMPVETATVAQSTVTDPFEAVGTILNRVGFLASTGIYNVLSLTRWDFDGVTGYGEDQDLFHPARWRDFIRRYRARKGKRT